MIELLQNTQAYRLLKRECEGNVCSHAYLLLFDDGRNLRTALKEFTKLLFSASEDGYEELTEDKKRIAKLIDEESYADCLFYPADGKKLAVEDAEKIREESLLSPIEGDRKVFVLGDFAEANTQTQNKLLKLLEEPPKGVVFLLGATTAYPVLQTVLSRTKKLEILPFPIPAIENALHRIYENKYDSATLELCAATSGGVLGEAQNILEGGYYKSLVENAFNLCLCDEGKIPVAVRTVGETKYKKELLSLLRLIFRDALLVKTDNKACTKSVLLRSEKENIKKIAEKYTISALLYAQEALSDAELQVQFNAVFPQCIEVCIANIRKKNQ
jgi:DNA polymerase III gamma/tau subunit